MLHAAIRRVTAAPRIWMIAGAAATVVLALFMEGVARLVLGGPMKPAAMICQIFGWSQDLLWLGEIIHYSLGLVVFPVGFMLVRPLLPGSAFSQGLIWGGLLWLGAAAVVAPLAGMPIFFGGGRILLASLVAHLAYGAVLAVMVRELAPDAILSSRQRVHQL